jgi:hypothetical protein
MILDIDVYWVLFIEEFKSKVVIEYIKVGKVFVECKIEYGLSIKVCISFAFI